MAEPTLDAILTPLELPALGRKDLSDTVCVVFDILRATTTMVTALANGADAVIPVAEIPEALDLRRRNPSYLLAGERDGHRILAPLTGGPDFDLGNSPREFTPDRVAGKTIIMTTTNGTRALKACAGAGTVLVGSFLNLRATALWIREEEPPRLLIVCSGTQDQPALEDVLAAGALCEKIWSCYSHGHVSDGAELARRVYPLMRGNLPEAMKSARNGRRLLAQPDLRDDVWFCVQRETVSFVAGLIAGGRVGKLRDFG
jgi:2-phosphosulfolactate phosphatase